jgi:DNA-directed RNA polymerase
MPIIDASSSDIVTNEGVYRRIQSTLRVRPTKVIVKSKQKSAVAPNVIHSMDASHLMLTTLASIREGVQCFSLIHDSFGTHASHMPVLFRVVREQMVEMYQAYDPLWEIKSRAEAVLSEKGKAKLGELPERGDLDLNLIKASDYAFA